MNSPKWQSVPDASREGWRKAFAVPRAGVDVRGPCPVCGADALHRYYQVGAPLPATAEGTFVARGALWEWCSSCRSYEHASALVPSWWQSDVAVDERGLTALPDVLERFVAARSPRGPKVDVVELWLSEFGADELLARFVLNADGKVFTVAKTPHHRKVADATVARVPGPDGTWLTRDDGRRFLELLAANLRGSHLVATKILEMDIEEAMALEAFSTMPP